MKKPIIGIVSKHYSKNKVRPDTYIRDEVKQAIFDNGGIAFGILPPDSEIKHITDDWKNDLSTDEYENLINQIKLCDGIIIQGGGDSDNYECIVAKYCYDTDVPTLGICCGQNIMVRALDGTTKSISNPEKHFDVDNSYVHSISIDKSSKFYQIINKDEIMVNSRHKKVVDKCPLLDKVAFCSDGYADVVESKEKKFYIAVRFHPESLYRIDSDMNKIFKAFIEVCKTNNIVNYQKGD